MQLGQWEQEDGPFKGLQRWSPSCEVIKGLFVGNIPISSTDQPVASALTSQQSTRSGDVCGSKRNKYIFLYLFFCCVRSLMLSLIIVSVLFTVVEPRVLQTQDKATENQ